MSTLTAVRKEMSRGSALITLMVIIMVVAVAGVAMMGFAKSQAYSATRARDFLKAQAYAEAGANQAYSLLRSNFAARNDASKFPLHSFGDGSYDADVTPVGDTAALITCTGTRGTATAVVKLDIKNFGVPEGGTVPPTSPWAYGIFVNGFLDHNGTGTQTGNAQVNNYLISSGGGGLLWGAADQLIDVNVAGVAGATFNGGGTIFGTLTASPIVGNPTCTKVEQRAATVPMPDLSGKLMEYYGIALANGQVFDTAPASGNLGTFPGGVRWYNCSIDMNGGVSYVGCLIATGDIVLRGGLNQTKVGGLPALVSRDGAITMKGAHDVHGLVYAKGDVLWNGAGSIVGEIVVGGNMRFNGAYGNLAYEYSEPGTPGGGSSAFQDKVGVTAWQR